MTAKRFIGPALVVVVIVGGYFIFKANASSVVTDSSVGESQEIQNGWIDVTHVRVTSLDANNQELGELKSGDEITAPMTLKTDANGSATINFTDGSNLRIDPNTTVKITEGSYDPNSSSLKVKVALVSGKIWSKITSLSTPESHWEARTGTAVATVRGTAFSLEYTSAGETKIVSSEHTVAISPIDPDTGDVIAGAEVNVNENQTLTLNHDQIKTLKALTKEERESRVENILKVETESGTQSETPTPSPAPSTSSNSPSPSAKPKMISLTIVNKADVLKLVEGTSIAFDARANYSDGSSVIVTDRTQWQAVGSIGKITRPGILEAKLGDDVSEIGTAFGAVTASYKSESGETFTAKSEIITVTGAVPPLQDTRG